MHFTNHSDMAIHYDTPLDRTFHALGDGTRRQLLAILASEGTRTAGELSSRFDAAQPTLSKHLKVLEAAGLISRRVEGRTHHIDLETAQLSDAQDWIYRHKEMWNAMLDNLENYLGQTAS